MSSGKKQHARKPTTGYIIWFLAIICTIICIAVIISGIAVFIGYMVIHPRIPTLSVANAHLDTMQYSQAGLLKTAMNIIIRAENDNTKAHASFSDTSFILSFQGLALAKLVANPFDVNKNSSTDFNYVVTSSEIPLDSARMHRVDLALKQKVIAFDFKGNSRTRWRVSLLGSVKFWCHLNCQLRFHPLNGTYIRSRCSSKSKWPFFIFVLVKVLLMICFLCLSLSKLFRLSFSIFFSSPFYSRCSEINFCLWNFIFFLRDYTNHICSKLENFKLYYEEFLCGKIIVFFSTGYSHYIVLEIISQHVELLDQCSNMGPRHWTWASKSKSLGLYICTYKLVTRDAIVQAILLVFPYIHMGESCRVCVHGIHGEYMCV